MEYEFKQKTFIIYINLKNIYFPFKYRKTPRPLRRNNFSDLFADRKKIITLKDYTY